MEGAVGEPSREVKAWDEIRKQKIVEKYGVRAHAPENMPWNMRDLMLVDPSGILWRISQALPEQA